MIKNRTTYAKVLRFVTLRAVLYLVLFICLILYVVSQEQKNHKENSYQFQKEVNSLLNLNNEQYITLLNENSYWDEMVDFIEGKKDINWFDTSVGSLVNNYKLHYISIYNANQNLIISANSNKISNFNNLEPSVFTYLNKNKYCNYYKYLNGKTYQIYGTTIHLSNDPLKNKTKPFGYLIAIRLLDESYFSNLEKTSGSEIELVFDENTANTSKYIYAKKYLYGLDNNIVGTLEFTREFTTIFYITKCLFLILISISIINFIIVLYYAKSWVYFPVKLIKSYLETENFEKINSLEKVSLEYEYIAKLLKTARIQKKELQIAILRAEESDRLKSAFLTNISHEIRTPMNAVLGFSELALDENLTSEERQKFYKIIKSSSNSLLEIITDLVEMSKIDSKTVTPNIVEGNIDQSVKNAFNAVQLAIPESKNIDFKLINNNSIQNKLVKTDFTKLHQILVNLLYNAIKFTDSGFVVLEFHYDTNKQLAFFSVKDSGIGISKENQKNIFKRFSKLKQSEDTFETGIGLGLSIAKAYVEMLEGKISVHSEIGVGTNFQFQIPMESHVKSTNSKIESNLTSEIGNEELVLIAEDDNLNFKLIEKLFSLKNFKVIRATNGQEAIELCQANSDIHLVFMDLKMPILDGFDSFTEIKKIRPNLPIIAQTAFAFAEDIDKIKKHGFDDYITKPIDKNRLFELVFLYIKRKNNSI